jgi:hypothetical protein
LRNVDDLTEASHNNLEKNVFVSCWTESQEENIALWSMYAGLRGVRISLPKEMFEFTHIMLSNGKMSEAVSVVPVNELKDCMIAPFLPPEKDEFEVFYRNVEYVKKPRIAIGALNDDDKDKNIAYNRLGRFKHKIWEFQQEVRFALNILPYNILSMGKDIRMKLPIAHQKNLQMEKHPLQYVDIKLRDEIFNNLEIMLGPSCNQEDINKVQLFRKEYAPSSKIIRSSFTGTIKGK